MNDNWYYFLCLTTIIYYNISDTNSLKCRRNEHIELQQDFFKLATTCMRTSMNLTKMNNGESYHHSSSDQRQNQHNNGNSGNNEYYNSNSNRNNNDNGRNNYKRNRSNHHQDENTCIVPTTREYNNENSNRNQNRQKNRQYRRKRNSLVLSKYNNNNRKNNTQPSGIRKSPLEDIPALNSASKPDTSSMINVMTRNIRDPELQEFIPDSIDECFEITENDNQDKECEFSKNLILCLEEKAQKSCDDWVEGMEFGYWSNQNNQGNRYNDNNGDHVNEEGNTRDYYNKNSKKNGNNNENNNNFKFRNNNIYRTINTGSK